VCIFLLCQTDAGSVGHTAKEAGNPGEVEPGTASAIGAALVELRWPTASRHQRYWLARRGRREWRIPKGEVLPGDDGEVKVVTAERAASARGGR